MSNTQESFLNDDTTLNPPRLGEIPKINSLSFSEEPVPAKPPKLNLDVKGFSELWGELSLPVGNEIIHLPSEAEVKQQTKLKRKAAKKQRKAARVSARRIKNLTMDDIELVNNDDSSSTLVKDKPKKRNKGGGLRIKMSTLTRQRNRRSSKSEDAKQSPNLRSSLIRNKKKKVKGLIELDEQQYSSGHLGSKLENAQSSSFPNFPPSSVPPPAGNITQEDISF